jgi:serine/threonine protein kinase
MFRAVTDPRTSRRVALKKMPNVFQSVVAARRAFREIKMLCTFRHDNVIHLKTTYFSNLKSSFFTDFTSC